jgi:hypothetical protein
MAASPIALPTTNYSRGLITRRINWPWPLDSWSRGMSRPSLRKIVEADQFFAADGRSSRRRSTNTWPMWREKTALAGAGPTGVKGRCGLAARCRLRRTRLFKAQLAQDPAWIRDRCRISRSPSARPPKVLIESP